MVAALIVFALGVLGPQDAAHQYARAKEAFDAAANPLESMRALAAAEPDNPWAWHFVGRAHQERRELTEASKALRRARDLDPKNAWHDVTLGSLATMAADTGGAARCYGQAASKETREAERAEWRRWERTFHDLAEKGDAAERRLRAIFWGAIVLLAAGLAVLSR